MPTIRRSRMIPATPEQVWRVLSDPHHLPRWWPKVERVEGVSEERWTHVLLTKKGRPVRVDFRLVESYAPTRYSWEQEIPGTPFERVLAESVVSVEIVPADEASQVTIVQRQRLRGYSRSGGFMLRRATRKTLDEALEGLARIA